MNRKDRRNNDPEVRKRREKFSSDFGQVSAPFGNLPQTPVTSSPYGVPGTKSPSGGYGFGNVKAEPATGTSPSVNPFVIPKGTGLNIISQTFPSNYYVEWDLTSWRQACDQATLMGYTLSYATLTTWAYECSPFVQSLFSKMGSAIDEVEFFITDKNGNRLDELTEELVSKPWLIQLRREILFSYFWGFSGFNFDPIGGKIYKYPMQEIDPINRLLKQSTYAFYDGFNFAEHDNLLFVQPSTSYESFLGWMQPITRSFIQMNKAKNNWISAGLRLAFPLLTVGYPQNDNGNDPITGLSTNKFLTDAQMIAANIDPSKGLVYPYTIDGAGNIQKAIEIDFQDPKAGQNMYKIYSEFNDDEKNDIREMILGGTLSSSGSKSGSGSRSLGEVHERMFQTAVKSKIDYVVSVLNNDFIPKISKFYKGLPDGWRYDINRAKPLTIEEMGALAGVVTSSGYRFTTDFFEANGISKEFIEDAPEPAVPVKPQVKPDPDPDVNFAYPIPSFAKAKKKYF